MNRKILMAGGVTLLVAASAFVVFTPRKKTVSQPQSAAPLPVSVAASGLPVVAPSAPAADASAPAVAALRQGDDARSVAEYTQALRQLYEARGYHLLQFDAQQPAKAPAIPRGAEKLFWMVATEDAQMIGAFGRDANPLSAAVAAAMTTAESYVTTVRARAGGGSHWETQRVTDDGASGLSESALAMPAVIDPEGIPKHPSLSGVVSLNDQGGTAAGLVAIYSSHETAASLLRWYREQMAAQGWQFSADETTGAQLVAQGALCFVRGAELCLICINANEGADESADEAVHITSVIVSVRKQNV